MGSAGVRLRLSDGSERRVDHVLLGTGYRVDVSRYSFIAPELLKAIPVLDGSPRLTRGFASAVPGLHFIGAAAAREFGPLLYFVAGEQTSFLRGVLLLMPRRRGSAELARNDRTAKGSRRIRRSRQTLNLCGALQGRW